jgi:hypothetical protein
VVRSGGLTLTIPGGALRHEVVIEVARLQPAKIPGAKADGRELLGLWRIECKPPQRLHLAAVLSHPKLRRGRQEFRLLDGPEPRPAVWRPLPDRNGRDRTVSRIG